MNRFNFDDFQLPNDHPVHSNFESEQNASSGGAENGANNGAGTLAQWGLSLIHI